MRINKFLFSRVLQMIVVVSVLSLAHSYFALRYPFWIVLGCVVSIIVVFAAWPKKIDTEFQKTIIVALRAFSDYLNAITLLLLRESHDDRDALGKKIRVESVFKTRRVFFAHWVDESGLSPAQREGHRYFLIKLEQVGQILFAMHYVARYSIDPALLELLQQPIKQCILKLEKIILDLVDYVELTVPHQEDVLIDAVGELESTFREVIPIPLELLDMSKEYLYLAEFVCDLKDLQKILLKLAEALR